MTKDDELYIMKIDYGRPYPIRYVTEFIKEHGGYTLTSPDRRKAMEAPFFTMQKIRACLLRRQIMYKDYAIRTGGIIIEKADAFKKKTGP